MDTLRWDNGMGRCFQVGWMVQVDNLRWDG